MPKAIPCDLLSQVVSSYDQTKTTIQGRVASQTFNSQSVLAPRKNVFMDVFTDTAVVLNGSFFVSSNNRVFIPGPEAAGVASILLYNFDVATGTSSYVGRVNFAMPDTAATAHTWRFAGAIDTGTTGWKILVATTGSVLINGGLFMLNNMALSDFVPVGFPTIGFATGSNQKAVYDLQDPANIGVNHLMTAVAGGDVDGTDIWIHNGVSATHQYWKFDGSVNPTYTTQNFTVTIATPGVVTATAHGYNNNDPVILSTTGTLPTGLTTGTVYFVRNAAANTFELSATTGGASINTTGAQSGTHSVGRAFGTSSNNFVFKTGNLPALNGTLLASDSERIVTPTSVPASVALNGTKCFAFSTNTTLYMGMVSELTNGAVTWPSLASANAIGGASEYTAITPAQSCYSAILDKFIYNSNTSTFYVKSLQNSVISNRFGALDTDYEEGVLPVAPEPGAVTIVGLTVRNGWVFTAGSTTGQRGITAYDLRSHDSFDYSYITTKVLTLPNTTIRSITPLLERLVSNTSPEFGCYYRTSGFGSITGGWTAINLRNRINLGVASQIQFKIVWRTARMFTTNPGGIQELLLEVLDNNETSSKWSGNNDNTTSSSPAHTAFRLLHTYDTSVPQLFFRAYDDSGVLVASADTTSNPSFFEYSTTNGASWVSLGTIPNTVGTLIRYNWTSPPGVQVTVSLRE